ncbi:unnamed protein product [Protopolystoma xenopodis]|uniref:Uncharacterized protein n=1 Tax=Protopolystoma xenopodis TaxID=117903 RepID=A0A3S5AFZ3_9PLAT|nr:unnamed protein product [Protopolystoma xenopodis]
MLEWRISQLSQQSKGTRIHTFHFCPTLLQSPPLLPPSGCHLFVTVSARGAPSLHNLTVVDFAIQPAQRPGTRYDSPQSQLIPHTHTHTHTHNGMHVLALRPISKGPALRFDPFSTVHAGLPHPEAAGGRNKSVGDHNKLGTLISGSIVNMAT